MATVPTMANWTAGEKPTAVKLNTNIRDAGNFLLKSPACVLRNTVTFTVAHNTTTTVPFNTSTYDNDTMGNLSTEQITINTPGLYEVRAFAPAQTGSTSGDASVEIYNNTTSTILARGSIKCGGGWPFCECTVLYPLTAGTVLIARVFQSTGATVTFGGATGELQCRFEARWVGAL